MSLQGKVAIVTGAAQGLGRAFSEILLKNGAKVMLSDVNKANGEKTLSELRSQFGQGQADFVKCDVTSQKEIDAMFAAAKSKLGGIDIVVNNAGVGIEGDKWELTIDINVKGTIKGTTTALNHLRKDKGGKGGVIVNVASMAGLNPNPCGPVYGASKAAIIMFSQCWAMNPDVSGNGVRINVLAPAFADTDMVRQLKEGSGVNRPEMAAKIIDMVGVMKVEDVAAALLELITDESKTSAVLKISAKTGKTY